MRVWRISRRIYPPLDGEGARLFGGRWNSRGSPVVYTAGSLALAVLEVLVHTDRDLIPNDLHAFEIEIPDAWTPRIVSLDELPAGWDAHDELELCQRFGDAWIHTAAEAVLAVPSAIVPEELNYLINVRHPDAEEVRVVSSRPFTFNPRLFP
jgi:RES domain-containing protein